MTIPCLTVVTRQPPTCPISNPASPLDAGAHLSLQGNGKPDARLRQCPALSRTVQFVVGALAESKFDASS